ncbi:hypothetical protein [Methylobacterium fujisawaense]
MCDPLTIAGAALSAGGIAANSIGQSQVAAASNRAAAAESARQAQLRQEAAGVQAHSNSLYQDYAGKQADRATDLASYLRSNQLPAQGQAPSTVEAPATTSNITTQGEASQRARADGFAEQQAGALADMRSFGDLLGTNALAQGRDASQIGQIGNFMRGSASVLPIELNAASHAGDTFKTLGGLGGGLGKVGIAAGINGSTLGNIFGGAASSGGNVSTSLPTMAASGVGSIANAYAGLPAAPMTVGQPFGGAPSFASSPYRV